MRLSGIALVRLPARPLPQHAACAALRRCLSTSLRSTTATLAALPRISSSAAIRCRRLVATDAASFPSASSPSSASTETRPKPAEDTLAEAVQVEEVYYGPLATTFRRLKILSLSSLTLTFALTPFIFVLETTSSVPLSGRAALAAIAMATSSVSTALVAWCGRPYVTTLRVLESAPAAAAAGGGRAVEMTTLTLGLHKRVTTVYDPAFLVPTSRPFATWELAEAFRLAEPEAADARARGLIPREETVAETKTADGAVIGRWVVSWDEHGVGTCREVGKVPRYFNVHQELLSKPIR
ncbi:hypothetical protein BD413DRAFT_527706 [Trametes elegans]|nr:hypothetical protein BD413DRAFT_527706 [Trametes elegans]